MKRILLIVTLMTLSGATSCGNGNVLDYLSTLHDLRGTSYWTLQCSTYITTAKHFGRHCGAAEFWKNGCGGALATVAEVPSLAAVPVDSLQPGDVLAFHGVHVAAYVGNGHFMDSDPTHNGVGDMTPNAIKNDGWFTGKVKILRWKN